MTDNNNLPSSICLECLTKLNQFNDFFNTAHESQEILKIIFAEKGLGDPEPETTHEEAKQAKEQFFIIQEVSEFLSQEENSELSEPVPEHPLEVVEPNSLPSTQETLSKKKKFNRFDCFLCKEQLSGNLKLIQHFSKSHPSDELRYLCYMCPTYVKKYRSYTRHIESHSEKRFACDICDRSFSQKITLVQHLNCHSSIKSYKCEECGLNFKQKSSLFKHRKQKHSNELPFCSTCSKTFVNNETLLQHLRSKHNLEKDIKCQECSKTFASRSALIYHRTSQHQKESDDGNKTCKVCQKKFKTSVILSRHNKNFH